MLSSFVEITCYNTGCQGPKKVKLEFHYKKAAMMISKTAKYALRAIVTIAQNEGKNCTAQSISQITQVPVAYLSKLMQVLVRAGLVDSQRGRHGGFVLTRKPQDLTIWDILDAIEPIKQIPECPLKIRSHNSTLFPLHSKLKDARELIEKSLRETTIDELLSQPEHPTPQCKEQTFSSLNLGAANIRDEKEKL